MKFAFAFVACCLFGTASMAANLGEPPIALVYKGPGSCEHPDESDSCSGAAASVALAAGLKVVFVGPEGIEAAGLWDKAEVWIQPGGRAKIQVQKMTEDLKLRVRKFVSEGGGYVGFCAGGFLATEHFGWVNKEKPENSFESDALGLLPGNSRYYDKFDEILSDDKLALVLPTTWLGKPRSVYWELGPYFDQTTLRKNVELVGSYQDGLGMTVRSTFGKGRVFVTAVHPEARKSWYDYYKLEDKDGLDEALAVGMVKWAKRNFVEEIPGAEPIQEPTPQPTAPLRN